jgi:Ca-activated chloride channel family protein
MNFANAQALLLLPIGFALFALTGFLYYLRQKRMAAWIEPQLWPTVIPEYRKSVFNLRFYSLALAFFFLVLGLARPQWGEREEVMTGEGMDILVLMDLSNSMAAEDVAPSRLNRAQTFVKKLLPLLPRDRVGIIGFAESAYLAAPLTNDFGYITEMVETLNPGVIQNQGTNVGNAIETAIRAFERGAEDDKKTSRAMILITDGEDFGKSVRTFAERVKDFGTGFIVFSVGTTEGAPIPIRNEAGVLQTYKRDLNGKPVVTRVNKDLAAEVASLAGGKYFELVNPDDAAYTAAKQLASFGRGLQKEQRNVVRIDRFQYFLALALLFFLIHLFVGYRRTRLLPTIPRRWISASMIALVAGATVPLVAQGQSLDSYLKSKKGLNEYRGGDFETSAKYYDSAHNADRDNPTLEFNEATALAKAKRPDEAIPHFQESTRKALNLGDYESAAKSLYNEGVTQHEAKKMDEAYDRLTKAIEMAKISNQPELERKAREALMAVAEQQQQQKDQKNDQNSKDDKNSQEKSDPKDGKDDKNNPDQKNQQPQQLDTRKRDFKSGTLSKDVAEGIMNDLSDREKQLYNKRLKDQKGREVPHDKDW